MVPVDHDRRMAYILHNVGLVCCVCSCRKHRRLHGPIARTRRHRSDSYQHDRYSYRLLNRFFEKFSKICCEKYFFCEKIGFSRYITFTSICLLAQSWLPRQIIVEILTFFTIQTFGVVRTFTTSMDHIDFVGNTF